MLEALEVHALFHLSHPVWENVLLSVVVVLDYVKG